MKKCLKNKIFNSMLFIMTICVFTAPVQVQAKEEKESIIIIQPRFSDIILFKNNFEISGKGKVSVTSNLVSASSSEVKITGYLQRLKDGSWGTIKNWVHQENGTFLAFAHNYYVSKGYLYRYVAYGYTYNGSQVTESIKHTSSTIYY